MSVCVYIYIRERECVCVYVRVSVCARERVCRCGMRFSVVFFPTPLSVALSLIPFLTPLSLSLPSPSLSPLIIHSSVCQLHWHAVRGRWHVVIARMPRHAVHRSFTDVQLMQARACGGARRTPLPFVCARPGDFERPY